jgi:acyl-CoA thioesterase FadM
MTTLRTFPFSSNPISITQDMCDQNGHMNVLYYSQIFHLTAVMLNERNQLCAIYETVLGHIDMSTRKTAEMTGSFFDNLQRIMQEHSQAEIDIPLRLEIKSL